MTLSNLDKVAQTWDHFDTGEMRTVAWSAVRYVLQANDRAFSGNLSSTEYIHRALASRLGDQGVGLNGAALACGDMVSERSHFETDVIVRFSDVDGFDISSASLSKYQPANLRFHAYVTDCNDLILEAEKYDLVVACHGAHHVYNLGNLFYQARKSLKDHGLFFMAEWIGPEHLQIPRPNRIIAKLILLALFDAKTRTTHIGQRKGLRWIQLPPAAFEPSEACNSTELMPHFLKYFKPLKLVCYAGLSYPVFEGIAQNIDQTKPINQMKIGLIHGLERVLTHLGLIRPLFVTALAEKRPGVF
jgi:SAM-dependent methyltransferase